MFVVFVVVVDVEVHVVVAVAVVVADTLVVDEHVDVCCCCCCCCLLLLLLFGMLLLLLFGMTYDEVCMSTAVTTTEDTLVMGEEPITVSG